MDCALQNGAVKVFAIDVGYNQLDWKLRTDERVVNMEKTNARYLEADSLGEMVDVITTDVSFISLEKILPPAMAFLDVYKRQALMPAISMKGIMSIKLRICMQQTSSKGV